MRIFLIRHGQTTGDIENRYGGRYDDYLTEKGREQAKVLARFLKDKGIEVIFSSPYVRATETSQIIAREANCEIIIKDDLRGRNQYGFLSGVRREEAQEKYPKQVELLKDRLNVIEDAESYEDFQERVTKTFKAITNNSKYKTIAIIAHGGPPRVLFRDILKWGEISEIGDCALVELEKKGDSFSLIRYEGFELNFQPPV
ncbi:MAG: histidine phosphatase family protein [Candidatus Pacebacteria bacterium]|nr:histidine phosphatase family protein [Candidatus Paceibacterota bacterium]